MKQYMKKMMGTFRFRPLHFIFLFFLFACIVYTKARYDLEKSAETLSLFYESDIWSWEDEMEEGLCFVLFYEYPTHALQNMESAISTFFQDKTEDFQGKLLKVNISDSEDICSRYHIHGGPTILIMQDKSEKNRITGVVSEKTLKHIYTQLNL